MKLSFLIAALVLAGLLPSASAATVMMEEKAAAKRVAGVVQQPSSEDFTRLSITPRNKQLELKPGEEREFKVRVGNEEEEGVVLEPELVVSPYGQYIMKEGWVSVTPEEAEAGPEEEQEFKVKVKVPEDAQVGHYSAQVAFTNETLPYPTGVPRAVNALRLSLRVWKEPTVRISPSYIHDRIEAGESHTYEINVENSGEGAVALNPRFEGEGYRCTGMGCPNELQKGWVSIEAPESVAPGSKARVEVSLSLPQDARGRYRAEIDLGVADPARAYYSDHWRKVNVNIEAWQQPTEPYRKEFEVSEGSERLTVEIGSESRGFKRYSSWGEAERPGFKLTLLSPSGEELVPEPSRRVSKGTVSLSSWYSPPWEVDSGGMYTLESTEYRAVYTLDSPAPGAWKAEIMPFNTTRFDYSITEE